MADQKLVSVIFLLCVLVGLGLGAGLSCPLGKLLASYIHVAITAKIFLLAAGV